MINSLSKQYSFRNYFLCAILLKTVIFLFFLSFNKDNSISSFNIYGWGGDSPSYIGSIDNLVSKGSYFYDNNNTAGRMPGFVPVYFPLRLLFDKDVARSLTIIFQLLFSALAIVYFKKTVNQLTNNFTANLTFLFLSANSLLVAYDMLLYSESIAISSLMLTTYFIVRYIFYNDLKNMFWAGIMLAWCVFMKPYLGVLIPFFIITIVIKKYPVSFKSLIKPVMFFALPFIFFDGIWVIRNYKISEKFIPLQSSISAGGELNEMYTVWYKFLKVIGGDNIQWNEGSHATWFSTNEYLNKMGFKRPDIAIFPEMIFTKELPKDSLIAARNYFWLYLDSSNTEQFKNENKEKWVKILNGYMLSLKENYPFYYYVGNKLMIMKRLVFHKYTYYVPYGFNNANPIEKAVKIGIMISNILLLCLGIMGFMIMAYYLKKEALWALFVFPALWVFFLFSCIIMQPEYRFFLIPWIYMMIGAAIVIEKTFKYFLQTKN